MKALVETTGDFMLYNASTGEVVEAHRPSLITEGYFLQAQLGLGQLRVLELGFPEEATDAEWAEWLKASDGDIPLATASFKSKPEPAAEGEAEAEGTPRRGRPKAT